MAKKRGKATKLTVSLPNGILCYSPTNKSARPTLAHSTTNGRGKKLPNFVENSRKSKSK